MTSGSMSTHPLLALPTTVAVAEMVRLLKPLGEDPSKFHKVLDEVLSPLTPVQRRFLKIQNYHREQLEAIDTGGKPVLVAELTPISLSHCMNVGVTDIKHWKLIDVIEYENRCNWEQRMRAFAVKGVNVGPEWQRYPSVISEKFEQYSVMEEGATRPRLFWLDAGRKPESKPGAPVPVMVSNEGTPHASMSDSLFQVPNNEKKVLAIVAPRTSLEDSKLLKDEHKVPSKPNVTTPLPQLFVPESHRTQPATTSAFYNATNDEQDITTSTYQASNSPAAAGSRVQTTMRSTVTAKHQLQPHPVASLKRSPRNALNGGMGPRTPSTTANFHPIAYFTQLADAKMHAHKTMAYVAHQQYPATAARPLPSNQHSRQNSGSTTVTWPGALSPSDISPYNGAVAGAAGITRSATAPMIFTQTRNFRWTIRENVMDRIEQPLLYERRQDRSGKWFVHLGRGNWISAGCRADWPLIRRE